MLCLCERQLKNRRIEGKGNARPPTVLKMPYRSWYTFTEDHSTLLPILRLPSYKCTCLIVATALKHNNELRAYIKNVHLMQQVREIEHQINPYVRMFKCFWGWVLGDQASTPYRKVVPADKRATPKHVIRYNGSTFSEVEEIVRSSENAECNK